jgi:hypothetical protein
MFTALHARSLLAGPAILRGRHRRPAGAVPLHQLPLLLRHGRRRPTHARGSRPSLHEQRGEDSSLDAVLYRRCLCYCSGSAVSIDRQSSICRNFPDHYATQANMHALRLQPEMSRNVQKYSREIYARASEALHCRVHATLMLPLFTEQSRRNPVGVLEVVQVGLKPRVSVPALQMSFGIQASATISPVVRAYQQQALLCKLSLGSGQITDSGV